MPGGVGRALPKPRAEPALDLGIAGSDMLSPQVLALDGHTELVELGSGVQAACFGAGDFVGHATIIPMSTPWGVGPREPRPPPRTSRPTGPWTRSYTVGMHDLLDQSLRVIAALNTASVDYVVIGDVAMNLHGLVRSTEDLDLFVAADVDNVARLRAALRAVYDDPCIEEITAADLCGDYPAARYGPPTGTLYLDILTRLGEAVRYEDLEITVVELEGVPIRVATPRSLYAMKKGTVRPLDHADAEALRRAFQLR